MKGRAVTGVFALALLRAAVAAHPASLPRVAVQVEWRWVEVAQASAVAQGAREGARGVGTGGAFDPQSSVTLRSAPASLPTVQALTVMNGEPAQLRLTAWWPTWEVQLFRTPKGSGGALVPGMSAHVEAVSVRPRWPGGAEPVEVDITAESREAGGVQHWASTVQLPLNTWQPVLQAGGASTGALTGETRSADAAAIIRRELQLRVRR